MHVKHQAKFAYVVSTDCREVNIIMMTANQSEHKYAAISIKDVFPKARTMNATEMTDYARPRYSWNYLSSK